MNRARHCSRRYEEARPEIDQMRERKRLARQLSGMIGPSTTEGELRTMATVLKIPGRSRFSPSRLIELIHRRRGG